MNQNTSVSFFSLGRYNNEKTIVRNYKVGGVWGQEERDGNYILKRGSRFELEIKVHQHGYKVSSVLSAHSFTYISRANTIAQFNL